MVDVAAFKDIAFTSVLILVSIIGWFVRAAFHENKGAIKEMTAALNNYALKMALIEKDFQNQTKTLDTINAELNRFRTTHEDVVIMKRDMQTMWKRIDESRGKINDNSRQKPSAD